MSSEPRPARSIQKVSACCASDPSLIQHGGIVICACGNKNAQPRTHEKLDSQKIRIFNLFIERKGHAT